MSDARPLCMTCGKPFVDEVANFDAGWANRQLPKKYLKCIECRLPTKRDPMTEADQGHTYRRRLMDGFEILGSDGNEP